MPVEEDKLAKCTALRVCRSSGQYSSDIRYGNGPFSHQVNRSPTLPFSAFHSGLPIRTLPPFPRCRGRVQRWSHPFLLRHSKRACPSVSVRPDLPSQQHKLGPVRRNSERTTVAVCETKGQSRPLDRASFVAAEPNGAFESPKREKMPR